MAPYEYKITLQALPQFDMAWEVSVWMREVQDAELGRWRRVIVMTHYGDFRDSVRPRAVFQRAVRCLSKP